MIYTSYFGNWRKWKDHYPPISIASRDPHYYTSGSVVGTRFEFISPAIPLIRGYKAGELTENDYTALYYSQFTDKQGLLREFGEKFQDNVLLCYETSDKFCHRFLLSNLLIALDFHVKEL